MAVGATANARGAAAAGEEGRKQQQLFPAGLDEGLGCCCCFAGEGEGEGEEPAGEAAPRSAAIASSESAPVTTVAPLAHAFRITTLCCA